MCYVSVTAISVFMVNVSTVLYLIYELHTVQYLTYVYGPNNIHELLCSSNLSSLHSTSYTQWFCFNLGHYLDYHFPSFLALNLLQAPVHRVSEKHLKCIYFSVFHFSHHGRFATASHVACGPGSLSGLSASPLFFSVHGTARRII